MEILIFKTNVSNRGHVESLGPYLHGLSEIKRWNVDLLDEEFILRIEAHYHLNPRTVERTLQKAGYFCQVLQTFNGMSA